jgi:CheY-like chemotaxis protein
MLVDPPIQRSTPEVTERQAESVAPFEANGTVDLLLADLDAPPIRQASPVATAAERTAHRAAVAAAGSGAGRAVLVVERAAIARKFLVRRLQSLGYEVQVAEEGEQALQMIEQQKFAIVFVELALAASKSGVDGLDVCQAAKRKPKIPGKPMPAVVMITGQAGSTNRVRSSLAGCDAFLTKPLIERDFVAALTEVDPLFK